MDYFSTIDHRQPRDLTSEGVILLIEDLLQSGLAVRIKVGGRSMQPFLNENDIVTIQKILHGKIRKGNLVLFVNDEGKPLLHRVVRIKRDVRNIVTVQTKGDGLVGLDAPVAVSRILGCVNRIEVHHMRPGKNTVDIDLNLFRQRLMGSIIARSELFKYYFYRIKKSIKQ